MSSFKKGYGFASIRDAAPPGFNESRDRIHAGLHEGGTHGRSPTACYSRINNTLDVSALLR
jgi:hypothetical protein